MRVSEIRAKRIRVNQGLGVDQLYLTLKVITVCVLLTESKNQLQN